MTRPTLPTLPTVRLADVRRYRAALRARFRLRTAADCRRFVDRLGFCYAFTAGPGDIPGVFDVIGTRSVDRMWSWAWRWKDDLAAARRLFYGRILRRKPTYVSLTYLPSFYALSGNVGEPDDYLAAYEAGQLSLLAKMVYEYVERHAPVTTWELRRHFVGPGRATRHAGSAGAGSRFHRALEDLQQRFLIAKVAEVEGRGNYAYIWDTFARWLPDVPEKAAALSAGDAAARVLGAYLRIVGAASPAEVQALFRWPSRTTEEAGERAGFTKALLDGAVVWTPPGLLRRRR